MTPLPIPTIAKFPTHQPARPMLSRDADAMYWMSRYAERSEHEREHGRGCRAAVVDHDPVPALADRVAVKGGEEILDVGLRGAGRSAGGGKEEVSGRAGD